MLDLNSIPTDQRLPAFAEPKIEGIVVAETPGFEDGEGARATLLAHDLVVQLCSDGAEGQLVIPIVALLDAIQAMNRTKES